MIEYLVKDIRIAEQLPSILGKGCLYSRLVERDCLKSLSEQWIEVLRPAKRVLFAPFWWRVSTKTCS